jgi:hypothetical protein
MLMMPRKTGALKKLKGAVNNFRAAQGDIAHPTLPCASAAFKSACVTKKHAARNKLWLAAILVQT